MDAMMVIYYLRHRRRRCRKAHRYGGILAQGWKAEEASLNWLVRQLLPTIRAAKKVA
jgi:hypothetical protein